jgi:hypothetical protein
MKNRVVIGVLRVSVIAALVALLAPESRASHCIGPSGTHCSPQFHCTYLISGTLKHSCVSSSTGSEIFDITIFGVPGKLVKTDSLALSCSVFGTVDLGDGLCDPSIGGPDAGLDPDCGVEGTAFCKNPAGNSETAQGQPFTLDTFLTATGFVKNCSKNGRCQESLELEPQDTGEICINPNWQFQTFTASEFQGECCTCDTGGGFDVNGACCASTARAGDGTCGASNFGTESCSDVLRCAVVLPPDYQPGDVIPYDCCLLSDVVTDPNDPDFGSCPSP